MKLIKLKIILLCVMMISCNYNQSQKSVVVEPLSSIDIEKIDALDNDDKRREFLEDVFNKDQEIRNESAEILLKYGYDSEEDRVNTILMNKIDQENLLFIEYYLKKYGYPSESMLGEIAAYTPWTVIHHSNTIDDRIRNFDYLYRAYLDNNIDEDLFLLYLNRMYYYRYDNIYKVPEGKNEVLSLIKELKLKE